MSSVFMGHDMNVLIYFQKIMKIVMNTSADTHRISQVQVFEWFHYLQNSSVLKLHHIMCKRSSYPCGSPFGFQMSKLSCCLENRFTDEGEVFSLIYQPHLYPQKDPWYYGIVYRTYPPNSTTTSHSKAAIINKPSLHNHFSDWLWKYTEQQSKNTVQHAADQQHCTPPTKQLNTASDQPTAHTQYEYIGTQTITQWLIWRNWIRMTIHQQSTTHDKTSDLQHGRYKYILTSTRKYVITSRKYCA
jgi:hypothetical protein